jgi:hypothetical protein
MTPFLRTPDHGGTDTVLDGIGMISALDLCQNNGPDICCDMVQANQWRITYGHGVVFIYINFLSPLTC